MYKKQNFKDKYSVVMSQIRAEGFYFLINDHEIDKNHDMQAKSDNKNWGKNG